MNVLMVASECYPLIKTGGLADVVGALPRGLEALGHRTRVMLPNYPAVAAGLVDPHPVARYDDLFGGPGTLLAARSRTGLDVLALDARHLFGRSGNPYLGPDGRDWSDNHLRFAALALAAARFVADAPDDWSAEIVHCHDWQAGLVPVYLREEMTAPPPLVFTIHNIAFPGLCPAAELHALRLPPSGFTPAGFEYYGQISYLKAGLVYADALTTVSPTYAAELQTEAFGMGFDGVLRARRADLVGILNGVDDEVWNPGADPFIKAPYGPDALEGKRANRAALQETMGLEPDPSSLLFCVVSRLTGQKGLDLLAGHLPTLVARGGQLALLGTGSPELETLFREAVARHRGRIGVKIGYDEPLSHLFLAGADAILVPSRFEPCGLTQLYGLRYGTVPVVARTGGLADSVIDATEAACAVGVATGIVFDPIDSTGFGRALTRAFDLFADPDCWASLVRNGMRHPVGWTRSAQQYAGLYRGLAEKRRVAVS